MYFNKMQHRFDKHRNHMKGLAASKRQQLKDSAVVKVWLEDEVVPQKPTPSPTPYKYVEERVDCMAHSKDGCEKCTNAGGGGVCGWCIIAEKCVDDMPGPCIFAENHVSMRGTGGQLKCPAKGDELKWLETQSPPFLIMTSEDAPEGSEKIAWGNEKLDTEMAKLRKKSGQPTVSRASLDEFFAVHVAKGWKESEDALVGPGRPEMKKMLLERELKRYHDSVNRILTQFTMAKAHNELEIFMLESFGAAPEFR
jgi:hypothetical protein